MKELTDEERSEKRKKDFAHALSGMDRAVQWIREHQDVLNGFTLHLYPDREFGVEVNLSFIDGDRQEAVKKLFAGRVVKKKKRDEEEKFELIDELLLAEHMGDGPEVCCYFTPLAEIIETFVSENDKEELQQVADFLRVSLDQINAKIMGL